MLGTILGIGDAALNKLNNGLAFRELSSSWVLFGEPDICVSLTEPWALGTGISSNSYLCFHNTLDGALSTVGAQTYFLNGVVLMN